MRHTVRSLAAIAALMLVVPFFGCRWAESVTVKISDFESSAVDGVWLWRQSDETGEWERSIELRIDQIVEEAGGEYVSYSVWDREGNERLRLPAALERDFSGADAVSIRFMLILLDGDGSFRASTYNAVGESALSTQVLEIAPV